MTCHIPDSAGRVSTSGQGESDQWRCDPEGVPERGYDGQGWTGVWHWHYRPVRQEMQPETLSFDPLVSEKMVKVDRVLMLC